MTRALLVVSMIAMFAASALAFDPQPEPPRSLADDGGVRSNIGSIKMGDGSVRVAVSR